MKKAHLKINTSVTISPKALSIVKGEARRQDRSVSYILEKFIEEKAARITEDCPAYPASHKRVRNGDAA